MDKFLSSFYLPRDEENPEFAKSFSVDEEDDIKLFFDQMGFVIVRDVLTSEDCEATLQDIFGIMSSATGGRFDPRDASTWSHFPKTGIERYGSVQRAPIFTAQFLRNRTNPKVFKVWSLLLGTDDLLVNHDRACFFRPTKNVEYPSGSVSDMPQWSTDSNLHIDMNPWAWLGDGAHNRHLLSRLRYLPPLNDFIFENNQPSHSDGVQMQGVLNLIENREDDGGFWCVPGFHHVFDEYFTENEGGLDRTSLSFKPSDPLTKLAVRVPMRAGSMVVWDQRLPHGSKANSSSTPRSAQFLKIFGRNAVDCCPERASARARAIEQCLREPQCAGFEMTDLAKRLLGL